METALAEHTPAPPSPTHRPRPRLWTALTVMVGVLPVLALVSGLTLVVAAAVDLGGLPTGEGALLEWLEGFVERPVGMLVLLLPSQLALLAVALCAGALSPVPLRRRLGLVRPSLPARTVALLVLATPLAQVAGGLLVTLLRLQPGAQLEFLGSAFAGARGPTALVMFALVTLGAALAEELVMRGYVQRRLLQRWSTPAAVLVSGLFFALMHMDLVHGLTVLPLGLWFGLVAWRTGSVWPAIACHALNNLIGVLQLRWYASAGKGGEGAMEEALQTGVDAPTAALLLVAAAAGVLAFLDLRRMRSAAA